jgi:hypothetical protein
MSAEIDRAAVRNYLQQLTGARLHDREIKSIEVNPTQQALPPLRVEVGTVCSNLEPGAAPELVLAIFESTVFMVCTPTRGAGEGLPYFFAREDVRRVELLE